MGAGSITAVKVIICPWMKNGVEGAELNAPENSGTYYHMHFVLGPSTGNWHVVMVFKGSSLNSMAGLRKPFPANEAAAAHVDSNG